MSRTLTAAAGLIAIAVATLAITAAAPGAGTPRWAGASQTVHVSFPVSYQAQVGSLSADFNVR
jgi:hypothetical protein